MTIYELGGGGGFVLHATCDNKMKLFADGVQLGSNNNWEEVTEFAVATDTRVITIECEDVGAPGGIIASGDNGLTTDSSWTCGTTGTDTASWSPAYEIGALGEGAWGTRVSAGISPQAKWIWDTKTNAEGGAPEFMSCRKVFERK